MNIEVNPKVFAFTMLLFSQQMMHRMFNPEKDNEWKAIQPVFQELAEALSEENKLLAKQRLMEYDGLSPLVFRDFKDLWFIMLAISNFRITSLKLHKKHFVSPEWDWQYPEDAKTYSVENEIKDSDIEGTNDPLSLMYLTLWNVIMKGYKLDKSEYNSRHI